MHRHLQRPMSSVAARPVVWVVKPHFFLGFSPQSDILGDRGGLDVMTAKYANVRLGGSRWPPWPTKLRRGESTHQQSRRSWGRPALLLPCSVAPLAGAPPLAAAKQGAGHGSNRGRNIRNKRERRHRVIPSLEMMKHWALESVFQ